nr:uncharacterized protein PFB0765w-like isoform X2 [Onthophagus taurus]
MDPARKAEDNLDIEYLNTLRNIKPYITCIMNNHYIELVRVWLEKLSDTKVENKTLRNEYLVELGKQIVSGVFVEPFVDPPSPGALPPFKTNWKNQSIEVTKDSNNPWVQSVNKQEEKLESNQQKKSAQERLNEVRENITKISKDLNVKNRNLKKKKSKTKKQHNIHTVNNQISYTNEEWITPMGYYEGQQKNDYFPVKVIKRNQNQDDESSWMDVTDNLSTTLTIFGSGDATPRIYDVNEALHLREAYEQKIASLMEMIQDLKDENNVLNQHVDKYEKDLKNNKGETSIFNLATEVECLKTRLQELVDIKTSLQNNKYNVISEWQNAVMTLQKKLGLLQKRYNELKADNNVLIKKLDDFDVERRKELTSQKQKMIEFHGRETDMLKEVHARAITELESKFNQTMLDLELEYSKKMNDLRESHENRLSTIKDEFDHRNNHIISEYETKLRYFKAQYEERLNQKDVEIEKLEQLLQEQCLRMQEEVQTIRNQIESNMSNSSDSYIEKINFLQKCIIKMEKLYQKSEKENAKQLTKLRKELDYKTKTNQVLALTTQKAELLASTLDGKQTEVEKIFAELEDHYRSIIIEQQRKNMDEKRRDAKMIEDLKNELIKYKGCF